MFAAQLPPDAASLFFGAQQMISLKQDFPDNADAIRFVAASNPSLKEALHDYEQVCERMVDLNTTAEEMTHWAAIRSELVAEIGRIFIRLENSG